MNKALAIALISASLASANATQVWNWSFADETGQFITDGTAGTPGTYTLLDFKVTSSGAGATLGSLSAGDYATGAVAYSTDQPFYFDWDGSAVTQWHHSGANLFNWWAFDDVAGPGQYYFGWDLDNVNTTSKATYYLTATTSGYVPEVGTISVSPVPDAGSALAMLGGAGALMFTLRLRSRQ
jgi:hypothetical protein